MKILMLRANIGIRVIVAWMYVCIYIYILTIDVITNVAMCLMLHTCLEVLISFWTLFDGGVDISR